MSNKLSTAEVTAALIITIGLCILYIVTESARSADFTPVEPICHDRYQVTFKAVLRCDQTLDHDEQDQ